jgi:hypothetical protein
MHENPSIKTERRMKNLKEKEEPDNPSTGIAWMVH